MEQPLPIIRDLDPDELQKIPEQYRQRFGNHWQYRRDLANQLLQEYALPRFKGKPPHDLVVLDLGCSIGNFSINFAKQGYRCYGVDLDKEALKIAAEIAQEKQLNANFLCANLADLNIEIPPVDIAFCFDVIEHLHDDTLGALLHQLKRILSPQGCLVFHSWPTEYEYVFYNKSFIRYPLIPFAGLPDKYFNVITKMYASLLQITLLLRKGVTYQEKIKDYSHCNPLTLERMTDMLTRAGFHSLLLKSSNLYPLDQPSLRYFSNQPIAYANLYGVVAPVSTT